MPNDPVRIQGKSTDGAVYEVRVTDDGEQWTTVTERENDVFAVYTESAIAANKYVIVIDKNGADFPHKKLGQSSNRIDISAIELSVDASTNANGRFKLGIITRVNGTNADIEYFIDEPFQFTVTPVQVVIDVKCTPSQLKTDLDSGVPLTMVHGITNSRETNVAAVNTGVPLDSPAGAASVTPAVGDIIAKFERSSGSFNVFVLVFYHAH